MWLKYSTAGLKSAYRYPRINDTVFFPARSTAIYSMRTAENYKRERERKGGNAKMV
jgi:hypothetical protein